MWRQLTAPRVDDRDGGAAGLRGGQAGLEAERARFCSLVCVVAIASALGIGPTANGP